MPVVLSLRNFVEGLAEGMNVSITPRKEGGDQSIALFTTVECWMVEEEGIRAEALDRVIPQGHCKGLNITVLGKAEGNIDIVVSYLRLGSYRNCGRSTNIGYIYRERTRLR